MPKFHPHVLRDYALIADGERGAVVSPRGDIVWLCAPRWDCDAVFSTLIGGEGVYAVTPAHTFVWGGYYEEGTLIWRSRWITASGMTECREALAFPGDRDRAVLLRRIIAGDCPAEVEVLLDPRAGTELLGLGAAVDITHAASMAGLALADRSVRRVTLADALIETAFAAAGLSSAVPSRIG